MINYSPLSTTCTLTVGGNATFAAKVQFTSSSNYIDVISDDLYIVAADKNILYSGNAETLRLDESQNAIFSGDLYIAEASNKGQLFFGTASTAYEIKGGGNYGYLSLNAPILRFDIGGTEIMRINSAGNVGIATTSPGYKLDVNDTARVRGELRIGANINAYQGDASIWVPNVGQAFTVKANTGNVGIGTTSPNQLLELKKTSGTVTARLHADHESTPRTGIELMRGTSDTWGGDAYTDWKIGSGSSSDADLAITSKDTTSGENERVTIEYNTGNVGIGVTNPGVKLDVSGQIRSNDSFLLQSGTTAIGSIRNQAGALDIRGDSTRDVSLGSVTSPQALFVEGTNGNVGIGITSPDGVLHIKKDDATATFEIQGGKNSHTVAGAVNGEINFGANDASTTGGIGASIKNISQVSNGAHNGLAFYTGLQSRTPYLQQMLYFTAQGGLSFGTTNAAYGTSGQVLKSNADAPPSWVNASTVIGGPYLPLSAGSTKKLTDTLYIQGTNNTGSESVLLRGVSSSGGDFLGSIRTANVGSYDQEMRFYTSNQNGTTNENLVLTLDASQDATFAGNIVMGDNDITGIDQLIFSSGTYLQDISSNYVNLRYASATAGGLLVSNGNGTQGYLYASGGATSEFGLLTGAGQWAVRTIENGLVELRHNNAVKFQTTTGGVTITGGMSVGAINTTGTLDISATYPRINLNDTNHEDDWSIINDDGSFTIFNVDDNVHALKINTSNNTTFASSLTIPDYINHTGNTATRFGFATTDTFHIDTNGSLRFDVNNNGMKLGNGNARVTTILDQDNMSSDSATALATQQSIKAYVDNSISGGASYLGTWDPDVSLNSGFGNPSLSGGAADTGDYYVCSADGTATPNGTGNEPNTWNTGDWVIWNEDLGTGGLWQKIDNTTVLSGNGTAGTIPVWTNDETIGDSTITTSSNNTTFAGNANGQALVNQVNSNAGSSAYVSRKWTNNVGNAEIWRNSSTRTQTGGAAQSFNIYNSQDTNIWSGGTRAVNFNTSQNATFAGTVLSTGILVGQSTQYSPTGGGDTLATFTGSGSDRQDIVVSNQTNNASAAASLVLATHGHDFIIKGTSSAGGSILSLGFNTTPFLSLTSSSATFPGNLTVTGISSSFNTGNNGTFVTNDANNYPRLTMTSASAQLGLFRAGDGGMYIGGSANGFRLYTTNFAQKLLVDQSGNATFSGKVETTTLRTDVVNNKANSANIIYRTGTNTIVGNNASAVVIQDGGNVGIGTTSPSKKLEVVGDIKTSGTGNTRVILESGGACVMDLINAQTEAYLRTTTAHDLHFRTTDTNRMVIKAGGNVGIGTTTPNKKLVVKSPGADNGIFLLRNSTSGIIANIIETGSGDGALLLATNAASTSVLLRGSGNNYINSGNVGIGTTSPGDKLSVQGSIRTNSSGDGEVFFGTGSLNKIVLDGTDMEFWSGGLAASITMSNQGLIKFGIYGLGGTGTPTALLGVDNSGNVVKTTTAGDLPGGPYLPLAGGTMTGNITFNDGVRARFGTGADFQILHDASNTYMQQGGVGDLYIQQNVNGKDLVLQCDNGSGGTTTYFRLDGSQVETVVFKDFNFEDNVKAKFGSSADLQIYHDGSNSFIKDAGTGVLAIQGNIVVIENTSGSNYFVGVDGAQAELYYNGSSKLQTTNAGVAVTGSLSTTQDISVSGDLAVTGTTTAGGTLICEGNITVQDSDKLQLGNSQDLELYHASGASYIDNDTGHLYIRNNVDNDDGSNIYIQAKSGENSIVCQDDGNVSIYDNNILRLNTTTSGIGAYGYIGFGSSGTSTGSSTGFKYGSTSPGTSQGICITTSDTGGAHFDGVAKFQNTNTNQGAGMFQMINYGALYSRYMQFFRGSTSNIIGYIGYNGSNTSVTFSTTNSDIRTKKNITSWDENVLDKFKALQPKRFHFKAAIGNKGLEKEKGFIAQYETKNFPEAYQLNGTDEKATYGFHPMEMVPYMMKAIKDLTIKNEELERRIKTLES